MMDLVHPKLEHEFKAKEGKATYKQCKTIWALCHLVGLKPVWCDEMAYGHAVNLITKLELIREKQRGNG